MTIRVHVQGAKGRMGSTTVQAVQQDRGLQLCGQTDLGDDFAQCLSESRPDVMVEFTVAEAMEDNLRAGLMAGAHVVSGTTGLAAAAAARLAKLAVDRELGLLLAPNFCIGVLLLQRFARDATTWFKDVEILELHHDRKRDAPSGTALATAAQIAAAASHALNRDRPDETESLAGVRGGRHRDIPIHSVRLPGLLAHQEVMFGAAGQVLTLRHDTLDRQAFMPGVLLAIHRISERVGLVDSLERLLELQ